MEVLALELFPTATYYNTGTVFFSKGRIVNQTNKRFRADNLFPKFIIDSRMKRCFPTNRVYIPLGIIQSSWDCFDVASSWKNHISNGRVILLQEINHMYITNISWGTGYKKRYKDIGFNSIMSVTQCHLGPLLLTRFNFNPSMDK